MSKMNSFESLSKKTHVPSSSMHDVVMKEKSSPISLVKHSVTEQTKRFEQNVSYVVQQVKKDCIIRYNRNDFKRTIQSEQIEQLSLARTNTYTGKISAAGRKNIINRIENWHKAVSNNNRKYSSTNHYNKRYLVFITLTLSSVQFNQDVYIKRYLLKPFVRKLRESNGVKNYLWKAEKQKNGNIHFHLIIDKYIDKDYIQNTWNQIQEKRGYLKDYIRKYNRHNPPSTDVRVVSTLNKLDSYIAKYIAKDESNMRINGAVWKMSSKLISLKSFEYNEDQATRIYQDKLIADNKVILECFDHCEVLRPINNNVNDLLLPETSVRMIMYYDDMFNYLYKDKSEMKFRDYMISLYQCSLFSYSEVPIIATASYPLPTQLKLTF